uniref:Integrase catalytic domain-containing protein n=1 Tax=Vitis vinifera TaxID=29760 RepID=A5BRG8_VITVI|nr:hypothetical protein VITISV_026832 [Vitis vinifera]
MAFHGINQATSNPGITLQLSAIKPLTRNNFEEWYESFNVHMTLHNLDLALRVNEPSKPTDVSSANERSFYKRWEHSNRSCLMVMNYTMDKSIKECVPKTERVKDFLENVKANYTKIDKVEMAAYLKLLTTTMYDGVSGVKDHIIKVKHYFNKELMSIMVQHEVSLKKNETHSLALVTDQVSNMKKKPPHKNFGGSKQFKRKGNSSQGTFNASVSSNATKNEKFKEKCNFCHKIGHKQANCFKFKNWLEKKKKCEIVVVVNLNANMIETNIVDVHKNISKCRLHISGSFRRIPRHCAKWLRNSPGKRYQRIRICLSGEVETPSSPIRRQAPDVKYPEKVEQESQPDRIPDMRYPEKMERRKGDRLRVHGVGTHPEQLHLDSPRGHTVCSPIRTPLGRSTRHSRSSHPDDSISYPDMLSGSLTKVHKPCYVIPTACHSPRSAALRYLSLHHGPLCDSSSINSFVGCKHARMNLSSSMLWHKRLSHISRQRLKRLVRDGVLFNLDFSEFETYVVCLKGKITAKTRNEKIRRCGSTLDLIHRDICGPLTPTALGGYKYFITFIDDFSRYGYVELIHEKFDSLNAKRELRLGKHIKVVKSDRGGKYYGRYDEIGWNPRPFANFLLECSIDARYTMSGTPQRNGVAEMRNRKLLDMEYEYDGYDASDLVTYQKSIQYPQFTSWKEVMDDEMNSMYMNGVWNLVELPHGCKPVGCKWVFKTKCDSSRQIERYKARLVVKGYSQIEGIDFKETFSPVSTNDSFRVIMVIVAHFDLELHQMDVKTAFLNEVGKEDLVFKLNKSIYGLRYASRRWYLDRIITQNGFKENTVNRCIYLRVSGNSYIFLVLYVDDILLASNDYNLLIETKHMLSTHFDMKDLGDVSYVLVIKIFFMIGLMSLMYAQVCKRSDIAFVVAMLGRYLSNHGSQHWKAAKKVLRYLQGTKDLMLTYQRINILDVVGFCDTDFDDCIDDKKSTTCYIFVMARGIVSWKSVKQTLTASSTMENTRSTSRFKHIDVKFYFVKEKVAKSLIDIEHMSTKGMLADPPTKGLPIVVFHEHVSQMGLLGA